MRKDGQPRAFLRVKLKDLYKAIQSGELSERSFKDWLMEYRIKHYIKGDGGNTREESRQACLEYRKKKAREVIDKLKIKKASEK